MLNIEHKRGGAKARLLERFGYTKENWQMLDADIRIFHLDAEVDIVRETRYGIRYEILAPLDSPNGRSLQIRTIWQVDDDTDFPRLITLVPE